jgi:large subunit ribosomal protein L2
MALIKVKPTSPGRRSLVKVVSPDLHKGAPHAPLLLPQSKKAGRNNHGRITMRHQGGGHKQHYRIVDFKRGKDGVTAKVERLEYDPNRSANIALLLYADGERRYIIAPKGVSADTQLVSGAEAPIKPGNALPLRNIPVGTTIHCIEMRQGRADRPFRWCQRPAARARRQLRAAPPAFRRDPQGARRLSCHHR